jgi:hypothetical protein
MREVNLNSSQSKIKSERLVVNLTNTGSGEVRKLEYDVRKLSGKAAMEAQITWPNTRRTRNATRSSAR